MSAVGPLARILGPLLRRFRTGTGGNIAIMGALLAPVFVMTTALAVDTARVQTANRNLQQALDAAALAGAKQYGRDPDPAIVEQATRAFFEANLDGQAASATLRYNGVVYENGNFVLKVSAVRQEPTIFGPALKAITAGAWDHDSWTVNALSEVVIENRSVEMALVLDNSGSMRDSPSAGGKRKIDTLRDASTDLVQQLLKPRGDTNIIDPVKIGLVPFSSAVNVGTGNRNASWMDTEGRNPAHHADFNWLTLTNALGRPDAEFKDGRWQRISTRQPLTRFVLFDELNRRYGAPQWAGCVDSRPAGFAVTDTAPSISDPRTLFVPAFAPAETVEYTRSWWGANVIYPGRFYNDYLRHGELLGEMAAMTLQRDVSRYFQPGSYQPAGGGWNGGPNVACTIAPILPLTQNESTLKNAIRAMEPNGGTNIPEGIAWGWRVLSPGEPFTQGRRKDAEDNLKVLVLMTDGENTYFPGTASNPQRYPNHNRSIFGTYGFGQVLSNGVLRPGRIFDAAPNTPRQTEPANYYQAMNEMTAAVCENAKADGRTPAGADGVVIFTIAFDLPDNSPVKTLLRNCASNGTDGKGQKLYYDARDSNDLLAAFGSITEEISSLRISR